VGENFNTFLPILTATRQAPNVFLPSEQHPCRKFQSIERDINNYLLQHKEVIDFIQRRRGKPKFGS